MGYMGDLNVLDGWMDGRECRNTKEGKRWRNGITFRSSLSLLLF